MNFNKNKHIVQIIAPASRASYDESLPLLSRGIKMLQDCGFNAYASEQIISKEPYLFYAASLQERFADFYQALISEQVGIIWCLKGGYGSCEVANMLLELKVDFEVPSPKILIGFSDITSMHVLFNQHLQLPSMHAGNITSCLKYPDNLQAIINTLDGASTLLDLIPLNEPAIDHLATEGIITGGNLKVLATLIGTPLEPNFNDKILILEDVNEPGYAIMRDLMHLKYAGLLGGIKAIIFGDFTQEINANKTLASDNPFKSDCIVKQVLQAFSQNFKIPIFKTLGFGHGSVNSPVLLGSMARIVHHSLMINLK